MRLLRMWTRVQCSIRGMGTMMRSFGFGRRRYKILLVVATFLTLWLMFVFGHYLLYGQLLFESDFYIQLRQRLRDNDNLILHDTICYVPEKCYKIIDYLLESKKNGHPRIARVIQMDHLNQALLSTVVLQPPDSYYTSYLDTSKWQFDYNTFLGLTYIKIMFESMFFTRSVPSITSAHFSVLSLGLGGGTLNSVIHSNFPNANVTVVELSSDVYEMAKKWFGLQEDSMHRVIISDGLEFIRQAAKRKEQYDAIFLDACSESKHDQTQCPIPEFYKPDILQNLLAIIKPTGGLFVNIVTISDDGSEGEKKRITNVISKYEETFPHCKQFTSLDDANVVLVCRKQPFLSTPAEAMNFMHSLIRTTMDI